MTWRVAILGGLGLTLGCVNSARVQVAPWDFEDGPNPFPGAPSSAPSVPDPAGMVVSTTPEGTTDNGYQIRLDSVARKFIQNGNDTLPDSRPIWAPDGAPYEGKPLFGNADIFGPGELEDHGARYLSFEITPPSGRARLGADEVHIYGYVPEGAKEETPRPFEHGWDLQKNLPFAPNGNSTGYRTSVIVGDRSATHYRFAVADGPWTVVTRALVDNSRRKSETLLSGPWGKLTRTVFPRPRMTTRWTMEDEFGTYAVQPTSLAATDEYRVRFLDASGALIGPFPTPATKAAGGKVMAQIESRPWHWVELGGIHYNPDPKLWAKGYWGDEGKPAVSHDGATSLEAIVQPRQGPYPGIWEPGKVFAPDGKLWRGHPSMQAIQPTFSGGQMDPNTLIAGFHLDESRTNAATPAKIAGYSSDSPQPGQGTLTPLPSGFGDYQRPYGQYQFTRPATAYVQFKVQYASNDWKKVGEIPTPHLTLPAVKPEERANYDSGRASRTVFSVILRSSGQADLYGDLPTGPTTTAVKWSPDQDARVVARLKSGQRVVLNHNSVGFSGNGERSFNVGFELTGNRDAIFDQSRHDAVDKTKVLLSDIEKFEIETRGYSDPAWVVAKLPK